MYETQEIRQEVKEGQIFYTSWGYDQTNYDYIVVVGISPTKKTAMCQLAQYEHKGYDSQCNVQKPVAKGYGVKFRMKVEYWENKIQLRGSYPFCASEVMRGEQNPSTRLDTFSIAKENDVFYETDSMFGH